MLDDWCEVFITALDKTTKSNSIGFIRQGANFIQNNHSSMQLLGDYGNVISLDWSQTFALKNFEELLEFIDDVTKQKENLIQNYLLRVIPPFWLK